MTESTTSNAKMLLVEFVKVGYNKERILEKKETFFKFASEDSNRGCRRG